MPQAMTNLTSVDTGALDPIDIGKSLGVGVTNGVINTVGLPADALTALGYPSDWAVSHGSDGWRRWIEDKFNTKFYRPNSMAGRYAETIGEMAPMLLLGEGVGAPLGGALSGGWRAFRTGQQIGMEALHGAQSAAGQALRELPGTVLKHAVAPGMAVQTLEEALPESKAGKTLQKMYPIARRAIPYVPAATRYLGRSFVRYRSGNSPADSVRMNGDGTTNS
jgi:hypothetical protein